MSKKSEAKAKQGYVARAVPRVCSNCTYYQSTITEVKEFGVKYKKESEKRCGIGGFAVAKMATCNMHKRATTTETKDCDQ